MFAPPPPALPCTHPFTKEQSHEIMRKPFYAIYEQQPRSLISAFVIRCLDS